jgi:hypothetical protein
MKNSIQSTLLITAALFVSILIFSHCNQKPEVSGDTGGYDTLTFTSTLQNPDSLAWGMMVAFFQDSKEFPNLKVFETWAEQGEVYDDPCAVTIEWPNAPSDSGSKVSLIDHFENTISGVSDGFTHFTNVPFLDETRINRPFFDYVKDNQLWYQEGVYARASGEGIDLPAEAAVVKAVWRYIDDEDLNRYYWHERDTNWLFHGERGEPVKVGLTAFHIVQKQQPQWLWSTFEHVDNQARCDLIGCKDDFGSIPAFVEPHKLDSLNYPPGELTPELRAMFSAHGIDPKFQLFRLKGTMIDFVDENDQPVLLGSSVAEPVFISSSSCMTCHSQATMGKSENKLGKTVYSQLLFLKDFNKGDSTLVAPTDYKNYIHYDTDPFKGYTGNPQSEWYTGDPTSDANSKGIPMYQTDFMWQLAGQTQSRVKNCGSQN